MLKGEILENSIVHVDMKDNELVIKPETVGPVGEQEAEILQEYA